MVRLEENTEQAIEFFENEVAQFQTMLQGSLNKNYESHLKRKIEYYKMAIEMLRSMDEK